MHGGFSAHLVDSISTLALLTVGKYNPKIVLTIKNFIPSLFPDLQFGLQEMIPDLVWVSIWIWLTWNLQLLERKSSLKQKLSGTDQVFVVISIFASELVTPFSFIRLQIDSSIIRSGKTLAFLECEIRNQKQQLLVKGSHTKYVGWKLDKVLLQM